MRSLTVTAFAIVAASFISLVALPRSPAAPDAPLGSISTYDLTLAAPAMLAGPAADAF